MRTLGVFEHMLYSVNATIVVSILLEEGPPLQKDILSFALNTISSIHPLLRMNLVSNDDESNQLTLKEINYPVNIPCEFVSNVDWKEVMDEQMFTGFDNVIGRMDHVLWRVFVVTDENNSDQQRLLITIHHCISDGLSVMTMVQCILSYYHQIETNGIESIEVNSLPLLSDIEKLYFNSHTVDANKIQIEKQRRIDKYLKYTPVIPFDRIERNNLNRCNKSLHTIGISENLALIHKRSKEEGVTIGSIFLGCMYTQVSQLVMKQQNNEEISITFPIDVDVDLRNFVEPKLALEHVGLLIGIMQIEANVTKETKFWDLCRIINNKLRDGIVNEEAAYYHKVNQEIFYNEDYVDHIFENCGRHADMNLSNMGRYPFPKKNGNYTVKEFHGVTSNSEGWTYLLAIASLDYICYSWVYEKSLVDESTAQNMFHQIVNMVEQSHKIPSQMTVLEYNIEH
jgi:NRPS condensation-like uncharacterized protein